MNSSGECRVAGAILAGGQAKRLGGIDKGLLEVAPGLPIMEKLRREMLAAGVAEVAAVADNRQNYANLGMDVIGDIHPGNGPLGGIEAGLAHFAGRFDAVVFLPCDLPEITADQIAALVAAFGQSPRRVVLAQTGDSIWHPLCTVVHIGLLPEISAAVTDRKRKMQDLWRELDAQVVPFNDEAAFVNINAPEDLQRWRAGRPVGPERATIGAAEDLLGRLRAFAQDQDVSLPLVDDGPCTVKVVPGGRADQSGAATLYAGGWITCQAARELSGRLGISTRQMGALMDYLEVKVRRCGLGCFR